MKVRLHIPEFSLSSRDHDNYSTPFSYESDDKCLVIFMEQYVVIYTCTAFDFHQQVHLLYSKQREFYFRKRGVKVDARLNESLLVWQILD